MPDREQATREGDFQLNDDDDEDDDEAAEEWDGEVEGVENENDTEDVKDESAAYLEFLTEEVRIFSQSHGQRLTSSSGAKVQLCQR